MSRHPLPRLLSIIWPLIQSDTLGGSPRNSYQNDTEVCSHVDRTSVPIHCAIPSFKSVLVLSRCWRSSVCRAGVMVAGSWQAQEDKSRVEEGVGVVSIPRFNLDLVALAAWYRNQPSNSFEDSHLLWLEAEMTFIGPACFKYLSISCQYCLGRLPKHWETRGPAGRRGSLLKCPLKVVVSPNYCPVSSAFWTPSSAYPHVCGRTHSAIPLSSAVSWIYEPTNFSFHRLFLVTFVSVINTLYLCQVACVTYISSQEKPEDLWNEASTRKQNKKFVLNAKDLGNSKSKIETD